MTPYVTAEQFKKRFPETDLSDWEIENLLKAASLDTDTLTFNRITACGFSNLTAFQKERVQEAVLLQADFRTQNAELFDSAIAAYSLDGVSVTFDKSRIVSVGGAVTSTAVDGLEFDALSNGKPTFTPAPTVARTTVAKS